MLQRRHRFIAINSQSRKFATSVLSSSALAVLICSLSACDQSPENKPNAVSGAVVERKEEKTPAPTDAKLENFTSEFTKFSLENCRVTKTHEESGGKDYICPGYKSTPLHVGHHDLRHYVVAGPANDFRQPSLGFNTLGGTFEWRSRKGSEEPFALIYRYLIDHGNGQGDSLLAVAKVGREGDPGCVMAIVSASSQQNLRAREFADAHGENYDCDKDPIQRLNSAEKS